MIIAGQVNSDDNVINAGQVNLVSTCTIFYGASIFVKMIGYRNINLN